jgi:alkylhydroperoxidase family enzyme
MGEVVAYRVEEAHGVLSDQCCGYCVVIYVRSSSALDIAKLLRYQGQAEFNGSPEQERARLRFSTAVASVALSLGSVFCDEVFESLR